MTKGFRGIKDYFDSGMNLSGITIITIESLTAQQPYNLIGRVVMDGGARGTQPGGVFLFFFCYGLRSKTWIPKQEVYAGSLWVHCIYAFPVVNRKATLSAATNQGVHSSQLRGAH